MTTISFPGLGIESFSVDPVAFTIPFPFVGVIKIHWYALIIITGMILAFLYATYRAKYEGVSFDDLLDMTLFGITFGVIGARLYYVLNRLEYFDFWEVFQIWNGGLAIYGGIIAGGITIALVCRYKKISIMKMMDVAAPAVMIGQIVGRWGNFINGEAYGVEILEGNPLYFIRMGLFPNVSSAYDMRYFHPTFLYESLWNLIGFLLIHFLYKKKKFNGQVFLMYVTWYGFGRMLIEGLRTDSLYLGVFRISQVIAFLCFVIGGVLLILGLSRAKREAMAKKSYTPAYAKITNQSIFSTEENQEEENNPMQNHEELSDSSELNTENEPPKEDF